MISRTIKVNEYIEHFKEIKPHLDMALENISVSEIVIEDRGCKAALVLKIEKYILDHDVECVIDTEKEVL